MQELNNTPVDRTRLTITSEAFPRAELTAFIGSRRIFLWTLHAKSWGPSFANDARRMQAIIDDKRMSKVQAVALKASFKAAPF